MSSGGSREHFDDHLQGKQNWKSHFRNIDSNSIVFQDALVDSSGFQLGRARLSIFLASQDLILVVAVQTRTATFPSKGRNRTL